jgi:hypothetical protein
MAPPSLMGNSASGLAEMIALHLRSQTAAGDTSQQLTNPFPLPGKMFQAIRGTRFRRVVGVITCIQVGNRVMLVLQSEDRSVKGSFDIPLVAMCGTCPATVSPHSIQPNFSLEGYRQPEALVEHYQLIDSLSFSTQALATSGHWIYPWSFQREALCGCACRRDPVCMFATSGNIQLPGEGPGMETWLLRRSCNA